MIVGRFSIDGTERIGVFESDQVRDITDDVGSFTDLLGTLTDGGDVPEGGENFDVDDIEYLPPSTDRNVVFATALNYDSHIEEGSQTDPPEWPLIFIKLHRALVGHQAPISYHTDVVDNLDYEAELAAVIGKPARNVSTEDALDYVAGYTILNDISARNVQWVNLGDNRRLDWFSGKSMQATSPLGPYIVSSDDISDPGNLLIESRLNGETMQNERTSMMIRSVEELLSFISTRVELQPGDVIGTGTPEGVGLFQDVQLEDGDEIEIDIEDIGTLVNEVQFTDN